jgi:SSS family solute:Na+ symporter
MSTTVFTILFVVVYLVVIIWLGMAAAKGAGRSQETFFVAGRDLGWIPEGMSIYATIVSGAVFTGTVGLFYASGVNMLGYGLGYALLMPILYYIVGSQVRRFSRHYKFQTQAEIFGALYDSRVLRFGAAIGGVVFLVPYFAVNAVAMGVVLESSLDLPYQIGVLLFLVVTLSYATVGGLRSVAYTDVLNGAIALLFTVVTVGTLWAAAGWWEPLTFEPKSVLATSGPGLTTYLTWFFFIALSVIALPDRMLRMVSVRDDSNLKRASLLILGALALASLGYAILGLSTNVLLPGVEATDTVLPTAIQEFAPALIPLFIVTILATGMSTYNSGLLTASNIVTRDLYLPGRRKVLARRAEEMTTRRRNREGVMVGRILMVILTVIAFFIAGTQPPFIWDLVNITLTFFLQFVPLLVGAVFWERASRLAAEVGFIAGVAAGVYWSFFGTAPFGFQAGLAALIVNAVVFVALSLARGSSPEERTRRQRFTHGGVIDEAAPAAAARGESSRS